MQEKVFIADDDPIMGNLVEAWLADKGFDAQYIGSSDRMIETAAQIQTGENMPDVMICNIHKNAVSASVLWQSLRGKKDTQNIPFIFLVSARQMPKNRDRLCFGADEFVLKSLTDVLAACVTDALSRTESINDQDRDNAPDTLHAHDPFRLLHEYCLNEKTTEKDDMSSTVPTIEPVIETVIEPGLLQVLKSFEIRGNTGILEISGLPVRAAVYFKNGRIIHAYHGSAAGKKGLYRILAEKECTPNFLQQPVSADITIEESMDILIHEAAKEIETLRRAGPDFADMTVVISDKEAQRNNRIQTHQGLRYVFRLAGQYARVKDILDHSLMPDLHTYKNLVYLVKTGIASLKSEKKIEIRIMTGSNADLPADTIAKQRITVFEDNGPASLDSLRAASFPSLFKQMTPDHNVLALFPSQKLGRWFTDALSARSEYFETNVPSYLSSDRKNHPLFFEIIDTRQISIGQGLLAVEAAKKAMEGWTEIRIQDHVIEMIPLVRTFFLAPCFDALKAGGRVGRVRQIFGNLLGLHPILGLQNGEVMFLDAPRGNDHAQDCLIEWMAWSLDDPDTPVSAGIVHADADTLAQRILDKMETRFQCRDMIVSRMGTAARALCGPGSVGISLVPSKEPS